MLKTKYGNKITTANGIKFHSTKEANRYLELKLLEKGGQIKNLELQPVFPVIINGKKVFTYKADFGYMLYEERIIEDVKGYKTPIYRLKKKCVEAQYGFQIKET